MIGNTIMRTENSQNIYVFTFYEEEHAQGTVRREKIDKGWSEDSINSMMTWTKLSLLLQHETICYEPEQTKLQITPFDNELLFEYIRDLHAMHPLCSVGTNHAGHVKPCQLLARARDEPHSIIEHSLLIYQTRRFSE